MAAVQPSDPKLARRLATDASIYGVLPRQRLVAYLPHYAHLARHFASALNFSNRIPLLCVLGGPISWLLPVRRAAGLPAVRQASAEALIVAVGTSCRHQIFDGAARAALHIVRILERALA